MSSNNATLRSWYPPVILRTGGDITIQNIVQRVILRGENLNIVEVPGGEIVKVRTPTIVKVSLDGRRVVLRASSIWGHDHDSRYYTRDEVDDLLSSISIEVIDSLSSMEVWKPLSANQGRVLKGYIDAINTLLTSDNINLDHVQELVDAIETIQLSLSTILVNDLTTWGISKALTAQQGVVLKGLIDALTTVVATKAVVAWSEGDIQFNKSSALSGSEFLHFDETTGELRAYWSLGTEKVLNWGFTGNANNWTLNTWWTYSGNRVWHTANGTGVMTQSISPVIGELYKVTFEIQDLTVGSVTVTMWGVTLGTYTANGVYTVRVRATNTSSLTFTPTNTARLYIDNVGAKRYQLWQISTGKGVFNDKLKVSLAASNYTPGTVDHIELENSWQYSHIVGKFGTTIKGSLTFGSGGEMYVNTSSSNGLILQYGSTISSSLSTYAYMGINGMMYYWYGRFSGAVVAWSTNTFNAKLAVLGSKMDQIRYVNEQGYTLSDDTQYILDTTGLQGCTGTPTAVCSSYGTNQSACEAKGYLGCAFTIQYYCSSFNWDPSTCSSMTWCTPGSSSCSGAGDEMSCLGQDDSYGGSCAWNYYSTDCSPFDESTCNSNVANGCSVNTSACGWSTYDCSQHGDATACGEHSGDGCTTNYFACSDYNGNEAWCNEQSGNGCSYSDGVCSGGNFTSCSGGNGTCSGGGSCSSQTDQSACESSTYFTSCSGSVAYYLCEGTYTNGNCDGGAYGTCGGTAQCSAISVEATCDAEPGCDYTTTMWVLLPNSNTFYVALSTGLTQATGASREYKAMVVGAGSAVLTTQWSDVFENWATTKTLSTNYKYSITFFGVPGNCTDFGTEGGCTGQSGCSASYDEMMSFTGCSGVYTKYKRWYVGTMS